MKYNTRYLVQYKPKLKKYNNFYYYLLRYPPN